MKDWTKELFEGEFYDFSQAELVKKIASAREQVPKLLALLDKPLNSKILDLCCGYGRYSLPLAEQGYRVFGIDLYKKPLDIAKKLSEDSVRCPTFIQGDMRDVPFPSNSFEGVINLSSSFGYLSEEENLNVLREIVRVLNPEGRLLLDLLNLPRFLTDFKEEYHQIEEKREVHFRNRYNPRTKVLNSKWKYVYPEKFHPSKPYEVNLRLYGLGEMSEILESIGLKVLNKFGDLNLSDYSPNSKRMVLLATK